MERFTDITKEQKICLQMLVRLSDNIAIPIRPADIANRTRLSVRDVSGALRTLVSRGLVCSTSSGNYSITALGRDTVADTALTVDGGGDLPVVKIDLIDLHQPWGTMVVVYGSEPFWTLAIGESVTLGPFSGSRLVITAHVEALDHRARTFIGHVDEFAHGRGRQSGKSDSIDGGDFCRS